MTEETMTTPKKKPNLTPEERRFLADSFVQFIEEEKVVGDSKVLIKRIKESAERWVRDEPKTKPLTRAQKAQVETVLEFLHWLPDSYFLGDDHGSEYCEDRSIVDDDEVRVRLAEQWVRESSK